MRGKNVYLSRVKSNHIKYGARYEKHIKNDLKSPKLSRKIIDEKMIFKWDLIELKGSINDSILNDLINLLDADSTLISYKGATTITYKKGKDVNFSTDFRARATFEVYIYLNSMTCKILISGVSMTTGHYKDLFIKIRNQFIDSKISKVDLCCIILDDLTNSYINYKYAKKRTTIRNTDLNRIETQTIGSREASVRVNLYNKQQQLKDKKHKHFDFDIYSLEFNLNNDSIHNWRNVLDRLTLQKDILSNYNHETIENYAMMHLYIEDKATFKSLTDINTMRRMEYKFKQLKEESTETDLVPRLKKRLKESDSTLTVNLETWTGQRI